METRATGRNKRQTPHEFYKKVCKLTVAEGVAFWVVDFAISLSPISAEYRAAFSISYLPMALVEALLVPCCTEAPDENKNTCGLSLRFFPFFFFQSYAVGTLGCFPLKRLDVSLIFHRTL